MGLRVFKHTDVGAPALTFSDRGSLAALLRFCLITGGGGILPVGGWSEPFAEVNNIAVFRADAGNRQFYQIDDRTNIDVDVVKFRACESMVDIDTCIGMWFDWYMGKHYSDAQGHDWVVVADETSVVLFVTGLHGWLPYFFGGFKSSWANDPYASIVVGSDDVYTVDDVDNAFRYTASMFSAAAGTAGPTAIHRLPDGLGLGTKVNMISPSPVGAGTGGTNPTTTVSVVDFPMKRPVFFEFMVGVKVASPAESALMGKDVVFGVIPQLLGIDSAPIDTLSERYLITTLVDPDSGIEYLILPSDSASAYTIQSRGCWAVSLDGAS